MLLPGFEANLISEVLIGSIVTIFLGVGGYILLFPLRTGYNKVKAEWFRATAVLDGLNKELTVQRTNCLATLQVSNQRQVELLEKTVDVLGDIHLGQVEMSGYMKGRN